METEKEGIPTEHNTFTEFDVRAYNSPSRTFLYVRAIRVCFLKCLTLFSLKGHSVAIALSLLSESLY